MFSGNIKPKFFSHPLRFLHGLNFSFARSKKFFIGKPKFWTLWAERYERDGQLKEADEILEVGEQCLITDSEGLKKLRLWRGNFDLRVATGRSKVSFPIENIIKLIYHTNLISLPSH